MNTPPIINGNITPHPPLSYEEGTDWEKIRRENEEKKKRQEEDRRRNNDRVKKDYRLSGLRRWALVVLLFFTFGPSAPRASADTLTFPELGDRTFYITDVIEGRKGIVMSDEILKAAEEDDGPMYILINSPGGSVFVGYTIISAMERAKARGVRFVCGVTGMAASMAFQIFAHCDERYSLGYSMFLWHPVRISLGGGFGAGIALTPQLAKSLYEDLAQVESIMRPFLIRTLQMDPALFDMHYLAETLHYAGPLVALSPDFMRIVEDYKGIPTTVWDPSSAMFQIWTEDEAHITYPDFDYTYRRRLLP